MLEIILIVIIMLLYNELALDHVQLVTLAMIRGEFCESVKKHCFFVVNPEKCNNSSGNHALHENKSIGASAEVPGLEGSRFLGNLVDFVDFTNMLLGQR